MSAYCKHNEPVDPSSSRTVSQPVSCHRAFLQSGKHNPYCVLRRQWFKGFARLFLTSKSGRKMMSRCWEKGPDSPTDHSRRILVFICFSQIWDHSKKVFKTPHSKKHCSLSHAWSSFPFCGLSNRHTPGWDWVSWWQGRRGGVFS